MRVGCGCRVKAVQPVQSVRVRQGDSRVRVVQCAGRGTGIPYEGAYEADALFSEQVFSTASKVMRNDFTVHAINYTEAPNESGITVTIGG